MTQHSSRRSYRMRKAPPESERCEAWVYTSPNSPVLRALGKGHRCANRAKLELDGMRVCTLHGKKLSHV